MRAVFHCPYHSLRTTPTPIPPHFHYGHIIYIIQRQLATTPLVATPKNRLITSHVTFGGSRTRRAQVLVVTVYRCKKTWDKNSVNNRLFVGREFRSSKWRRVLTFIWWVTWSTLQSTVAFKALALIWRTLCHKVATLSGSGNYILRIWRRIIRSGVWRHFPSRICSWFWSREFN